MIPSSPIQQVILVYDGMLPEIKEVWMKYDETGDVKYRNLLMVNYLPITKSTAERIHSRLADNVAIDDLVSAGIFGLKDAIEKFDPKKGNKFETYATHRIRGSILDELREMDWIPRYVRNKQRKYDDVRSALKNRTGKLPSDYEMQRELGITKLEYDRIRVSTISKIVNMGNFNQAAPYSFEQTFAQNTFPDPYKKAAREDLKKLVTKGLSRAEKLIFTLYYYEDLNMKEIGQVLRLSEGRISQIHSNIIKRIRANFDYDDEYGIIRQEKKRA